MGRDRGGGKRSGDVVGTASDRGSRITVGSMDGGVRSSFFA